MFCWPITGKIHYDGHLLKSRWAQRLIIALAVAVVIRRWVWMPVLVFGNSMLPAFHGGQIVGINKIAYSFKTPLRGDVVAVWTGNELMIKRVIGLPDEEIAVRGGVVYINDHLLAEPYVQYRDHTNIRSGLLGSNQFVLAGDNRPLSLIAVVDRDRFVGRLLPGTAR